MVKFHGSHMNERKINRYASVKLTENESCNRSEFDQILRSRVEKYMQRFESVDLNINDRTNLYVIKYKLIMPKLLWMHMEVGIPKPVVML